MTCNIIASIYVIRVYLFDIKSGYLQTTDSHFLCIPSDTAITIIKSTTNYPLLN